MNAIRLTDVTLGYDRHPAVHHIDGHFEDGSMTAVIGPNGAGKSTLLKGIMGLLPPLTGAITLDGATCGDIAYLPQQADIDREFPLSVLDVVLLGAWKWTGPFGGATRAMRQQAEEALRAVGLEGFGKRQIAALSAGQRQRMLFARLLLQDCRVILLDEPFTAIDARTTADLLALVNHWHEERRTIIAVLHDFVQVRRNFPQTLLLARETIGWGATAEVLTAENLLAAQNMCEAGDDRAPPCRRSAS
ncbi:metal ABC transporter ATP-binding protein [Telmatospirillum siberiense]|uniref:ABC transporter n=1 Tax=Telmatospirillum siberiense TaxID=382514 RepID=A0A2N3Q134_9PROT|nr:ABC transporter ATP-binding protein [Telmatospirillum siberiense]PKU26352.1 ABC transporter [Telmatospirillum siberiense]